MKKYLDITIKMALENPNELFVGNLSFFCTEKDLDYLFSPFGKVANIRIKRNEKNGRRSLMYGFVCMDTFEGAVKASEQLHQKLFMGRNVK